MILSRMNLLRGIILSILASLGLVAVPATARAQVTSGENNNPRSATHPQELTPHRCRKKQLKPKPGFTPIRTTATS